MSTPKAKALDVKDYEIYKCACSGWTLFWKGCVCGAYAAAKADCAAAQRVADYEAEEEKRRMQEFFNGKITAPITFKQVCPKCLHDSPGNFSHSSWQARNYPGCLCGSEKP